MERKYDLWDKYFADTICDWDIWENWNKEFIVNRLHDDDVEETDITNEEIDYLLNEALDYQRESRDEDRRENMSDLECDIVNAINNSYSIENLNRDDIGKVLVRIASSYFEE